MSHCIQNCRSVSVCDHRRARLAKDVVHQMRSRSQRRRDPGGATSSNDPHSHVPSFSKPPVPPPKWPPDDWGKAKVKAAAPKEMPKQKGSAAVPVKAMPVKPPEALSRKKAQTAQKKPQLQKKPQSPPEPAILPEPAFSHNSKVFKRATAIHVMRLELLEA